RRWRTMQTHAHRYPERLVEGRPGQRDAARIAAERHNASSDGALAKDADAVDLAELVSQQLREWHLARRAGADTGRAEKADSCAQPGDARQVESARLQPPRILGGLFGAFRSEAR